MRCDHTIGGRPLARSMRIVAITAGLAGALSCSHVGGSRQELRAPQVPEDRLTVAMTYPAEPIMMDFEQLRKVLDELTDRVSVVHVIGRHAACSQRQLAWLDDVHRSFYRYGVMVIVVDLNDGGHWRELTEKLHAVGAAFPAAVFVRGDSSRLIEFLGLGEKADCGTFIVDRAVERVVAVRLSSRLELRQTIRDYLQKRNRTGDVSDRASR